VSVVSIDSWRLTGCSDDCTPRSHSPHAHEAYGLLLAMRTPPTRVIRTGPLVVDLDARTAYVAGAETHLSDREWGVLAHLASRVGRWCLADDIVRDVWGPEWLTGRSVQRLVGRAYRSDRHLVTTARARLRARLGAAAHLIETKRWGNTSEPGCRLALVETVS
jgi:DNA-binding response OmpR family regulator